MAPKEQDSLETTNHSVLEKTFAVNTYGPLLLTQALLPNLLKSTSPRVGNMVGWSFFNICWSFVPIS